MVETEPVSLNSTAVTSSEMEERHEPNVDVITTSLWTEVTNTSRNDSAFDSRTAYLLISVYSLFIFLIVVGNVFIIVILLKNSITRSSTATTFLVSLLVARTCIAFFVIPVKLVSLFPEDLLGSLMCKLCHTSALLSSTASVWSTLFVSLVTYIKLVHPSRLPGVRLALACVAIIWTLSAAYAVRKFVFTGVQTLTRDGTSVTTCTTVTSHREMSRSFLFVDTILLFWVPFCGVLYCYLVVVKAARRRLVLPQKTETGLSPCPSDKQIFELSQACTAVTGRRGTHEWYRRLETASAHMLATVTLLTASTALTYMWQLYMYWAEEPPEDSETLSRLIELLSDANPWLNVCVFVYFRNDTRSALKRYFCRGSQPH